MGEHCRSNLRPLKHLRVTPSHMFFGGGGQSLAMGKVVVEGSPWSPGDPLDPRTFRSNQIWAALRGPRRQDARFINTLRTDCLRSSQRGRNHQCQQRQNTQRVLAVTSEGWNLFKPEYLPSSCSFKRCAVVLKSRSKAAVKRKLTIK